MGTGHLFPARYLFPASGRRPAALAAGNG